jgi:long-chain acyl-CoA synthetase
VNCSPLYTDYELKTQLVDSGAKAIVVLENFAAVLEKSIVGSELEHVIIAKFGDMLPAPKRMFANFYVKYIKRQVLPWRLSGAVFFHAALEQGTALPWRALPIEPEDIAFLQYTGGTTGVPKGAVLTHRNIVANLVQHHAFLAPNLQDGKDIAITAIPLFHILALTVSFLLAFKIGAKNVLIANPRDIPALIKEFAEHRVSCFVGVNRLFAALVDEATFRRVDFSELRIAASGGSLLQSDVATKWKAITGKTLMDGYGLTEASPVVTCSPVNLEDYNGSCGLPIPSTDISIRGDDDAELGLGQAGELCVRGPQVMKEYWKRPAETATAFTSDGFLRTGDIANIDEQGFVRIVDRKKDMINVSGLKVYPNEVEEVVAKHPGVADVGAVGVPDESAGEVVKIVVVRRDAALTGDELAAFCRTYLAPYKVPRVVEFRKELPKTPLGKTLRRALRETEAADVSSPFWTKPNRLD